MIRTRPVNRGGPEDRDVPWAHHRFEDIGMIGQVRRRIGPQVRELRLALVGPLQKVQAAVVFVGLVQGDPDHGAIDGVGVRMHFLVVEGLGEKTGRGGFRFPAYEASRGSEPGDRS